MDAPLTDDSYIQAATQKGYGAEKTLIVNSSLSRSALLRFLIADLLPPGTDASQIAKATLRLYSPSKPIGTGSITFHKILADWDELTVSGSNFPASSYESKSFTEALVTDIHQAGYLSVDVTDLVMAWVAKPSVNYGIAIRSKGAIAVGFDSKESGGNPAVIDITLAGPIGHQGVAGPVGLTGPAGVAGPIGATGLTGAVGVAGPVRCGRAFVRPRAAR